MKVILSEGECGVASSVLYYCYCDQCCCVNLVVRINGGRMYTLLPGSFVQTIKHSRFLSKGSKTSETGKKKVKIVNEKTLKSWNKT